MLDQCLTAAADSRVRIRHDGMELGIFHGQIMAHAPPAASFSAEWRGEPRLELPHGALEFKPARGGGIDALRLRSGEVTVRQRSGRERLRLHPLGHSRPVKHLLQDAGIPPWHRASLPFVYCGDALVAVAGLGIDSAFLAAPDAAAFVLAWHPRPV
jgi:tRNA(Ile)-lysidine synthase